jgi:hypothetical protein
MVSFRHLGFRAVPQPEAAADVLSAIDFIDGGSGAPPPLEAYYRPVRGRDRMRMAAGASL